MPHATRPGGVSYIEATIDTIEHGCPAIERLLFSDGDYRPPPPWKVMPGPWPTRGYRRDNQYVGLEALRVAYLAGKHVLYREDDAPGLLPGAEASMLAHSMMPGASFVSFFNPYGRPPGLYPGQTFAFAQAVWIPWDTLAIWFQDEQQTRGDRQAVLGIDLIIAAMANAARQSFELAPNLVRHVGKVSAQEQGPSWDRAL